MKIYWNFINVRCECSASQVGFDVLTTNFENSYWTSVEIVANDQQSITTIFPSRLEKFQLPISTYFGQLEAT